MAAPQQPQSLPSEQQQAPLPAPAAPQPGSGDNATWPPDPQTLIQMMMDARFSILDEPAGDVTTEGADRQETQPAGTPPPQPQAQG